MIFLDNASTTQIYDEALNAYVNYSKNSYFNPSALYKAGSDINMELLKNRNEVLKLLGASLMDKLIFTSGATEANNMAINGVLRKNMGKLVFSYAEHPSVYNVAKELQEKGYQVEFVKLTNEGVVDENDFREKVIGASFVSIMHVCNETGAINDIKRLVSIAKKVNKKVIFHSDGVQAIGKIPVNFCDLGVDMYTISAHKIHGPKGVGALYVKDGINLKPLVYGGGQEFGLRSGTENSCGIIAFCMALQLSIMRLKENFEHVSKLKSAFIKELSTNFINYRIISTDDCSPYIVSFAIPYVKAETTLHMAEQDGVLLSNGSACSSRKSGNRILSAMGVGDVTINGSLRISFSEFNTEEEVIYAASILKLNCEKYLKII